MKNRRLLRTLRGHSRSVNTLAFSPDGTTLATAGQDRGIKLWGLRTWESQSTLRDHQGPVFDMVFTWDAKTLAPGGHSPFIRIWRAGGYTVKQK